MHSIVIRNEVEERCHRTTMTVSPEAGSDTIERGAMALARALQEILTR